MSKLSELLNPVSNPDSSAQTIDTEFDQEKGHRRYPSITSPLEALAIAATNSVAVSSPPHPTSTTSLSSDGHHRNISGSPSRPNSSHFQLPTPAEYARPATRVQQPFSPTLEQHSTSPPDSSTRRLSDIADGKSRELPPLRRSLHDEDQSSAVTLPTENPQGESLGLMAGINSTQGLQSPDTAQNMAQESVYGRNEPVTSQIRQPSTDLAGDTDTTFGQTEMKTEVMEDVLESARETSTNQKATSLEVDATNKPISTKETATPKAIVDLKREDSTRASPVTAEVSKSPRETSPVAKQSTSKKRPAPRSDKKVEKKGTASAIKKPAAKKRKVEADSLDGTPFSRRSVTPASSRASKTPAPRNRKQQSITPLQSSPAPNTSDTNVDDDQDMDEGSELFCICRKPDDHTWMIACDGGCEDWFHGRCVDMNEKDGNLIDKYICPNCKEKGQGLTSWKPMCRYSPCREPARTADKNPSKYCSDEHGIEFMRRHALGKEAKNGDKSRSTNASRKRRRDNHTDNTGDGNDASMQPSAMDEDDDQTYLRGGILRAGELKALASGVKDLDDFKKLGEGVLSPPRTASPDGHDVKMEDSDRLRSEKEKVVYTAEEKAHLAEISEKKEVLRRRRAALDDREKLLGLVKTRAKGVLEELKKEGVKDICGFDSRLSWSDEEFDIWRASGEGRKALESGSLGPPSSIPTSSGDRAWAEATTNADAETDEKMVNGDNNSSSEIIGKGICQKKRCERHKTWYKLQQQEVAFEKDECRQQMRKIAREETGVVERAMIRHLEGVVEDDYEKDGVEIEGTESPEVGTIAAEEEKKEEPRGG
ncbi:hypothetical protein MMC24_003164 [Lignoscripta atroalba]|nr:hypothetical protein [Lignoscripta atroalba]